MKVIFMVWIGVMVLALIGIGLASIAMWYYKGRVRRGLRRIAAAEHELGERTAMHPRHCEWCSMPESEGRPLWRAYLPS